MPENASVSPRSESPQPPNPGGPGLLAGRAVSRVGYGAMQLDRLRQDPAAAVALVQRAVELGVDHIDTAEFYGAGFSNAILREAVKPGDGVVIVSKVGAESDLDARPGLRLAQRPEQLRQSVEDNLKSLAVDRIDVVNLRRADSNSRLQAVGDQLVDLDDQLAAMITLRDEGKIGAIGLSSITLDRLTYALPVGIVCVQNAYSLAERTDEALLELCVAENIAWVPFFPLGSALPSTPKVTDLDLVRDAAQRLGHSASQVGLAWLLHHAANTLLIPGTASIEHLEANVAAGSLRLDAETVAELDSI